MGLKVDGIRQLTRDLEAAGVQVADLKKAFGGIAKQAATLASGFAPRQSGRLAASIRGSSAKNYATVTAGGKRALYAGPINYGWRRRNITGAGFLQRADAAIRPHVLSDLVSAVDKLLRDKDLS
jgi:hypothetical protein